MEEVISWITKLASMALDFGSLGTVGWVAAAIFSVLVAVGGFFLSRFVKKLRVEEAAKKTEDGRAQASAGVANEGREVEKDANEAASEIDRLIKKP